MPANWKKLYILGARASPAWGVFATGVAISVFAWFIADSRIHERALAKADAAIDEAGGAIRSRIYSSYDVIYGTQGLFAASEHVNREEFALYVRGLALPERHPAIRSINFAELVPASELEKFKARVRGDRATNPEGYPDFSIRPPGERAEYVPIVYTETMGGSERGLGLDLLTEGRRESVERARDTGLPAMSRRITLENDSA